VKQQSERASEAEDAQASGPWPFVTRRIHRRADGSLTVWSSRHHRKKLILPEAVKAVAIAETILLSLCMPRKLNWWIGTIFAVGSFLFALASVLSLAPGLAASWSIKSSGINVIYFAGSIPFTTAAYLQLFQAANASQFPESRSRSGRRVSLVGWRPRDIGWLSCAFQFIGTILFNFNPFDAMVPSLTWFEQDLVIWLPDIVGSILFLLSGYLAFGETCHSCWAWQPRSLSWWIVFVNLLGCVGFMASALLSIVLPGPENVEAVTLAVAFTLQGAICFSVGSLLMLPETALKSDS
jgi:hypothetical protein